MFRPKRLPALIVIVMSKARGIPLRRFTRCWLTAVFFPTADLDTIYRFQSPFIGHPTRKVYGIEQNTGALGHGLSVAVGMALAGKYDGRPYRVYVLLGDGELAEGS